MRSVAVIAIVALALGLAPSAAAQKKQKDPVLEQYLLAEFGKLNAAIAQLNDRLAALEAELGRARQQQTELGTELRNTQNALKTTDTSLSSFRLSTQQDLLGLKTDLTQLRQDVTRLMDLAQRSLAASAASAPAAPQAPAAPEGYISAVGEKDVTINLGSNHGIKVGMRFTVFRAADPKTQIGQIEVVEVIDANNSRATIIFVKPNTSFEFSDIVRPVT